MADLSEEQKQFIVKSRARFVSIPEIIDQFKEAFGTPVKAPQVSSYDATTVHGQERMGRDLQALFHKERKAYLADKATVFITDDVFVQKELEKMYFGLTIDGRPKSDKVRMEIFELSQKIKGGMFKQRVSEQEALDYVLSMAQRMRDALETHVTNPAERNRVNAAIKKDVEGQGANPSS